MQSEVDIRLVAAITVDLYGDRALDTARARADAFRQSGPPDRFETWVHVVQQLENDISASG
jgi:hypothetical protein